MFGGPPQGGSLTSYLLPLVIIAVVLVLRNSRPRPLKIERLWVLPVIYMALLVSSLSATPPPVTPVGIGLLVLGAVVGGAIGWQRARFTRIDIHPETHELSSRSSPIGMLFIFGVLVLRYGARDLLAGQAASLHLPIVAISDAFVVLAIVMLSAQRLEIWRRATQMLADAKGPPRHDIVS
jgi:hypothetical protein